MKTHRLLLLLIAIFVCVISGCIKQKNPAIRLENDKFITASKVVIPGDLLLFKWLAEKGKSDLSSFTIRINGDDWYGYPVSGIPADNYHDSTYLEAPGVPGQYAYSFVVTDTDGKIGEQSLVISVE